MCIWLFYSTFSLSRRNRPTSVDKQRDDGETLDGVGSSVVWSDPMEKGCGQV